VAWNPVGLGGPTAVGSNGETNGDAKFSKDYADAKDDAVNQRAPKSMEGKELAPQAHPSYELLSEMPVSLFLSTLFLPRSSRN
jgi:uncharacterized protein YceK